MKKSYFQKRFRELLANCGRSVVEVGNETGISLTTLRGWLNEDDRTPQWSTLVKIADFFGVTPESMKDENAPAAPPTQSADQHARITKLETRLASAEGRIAELESAIRNLLSR